MTGHKEIGLFICLSGNGSLKVESLRRMIGYAASFGYSFVELGLDDLIEVTDEPYYGYFRGRYTQKELRELDAFAREKGVELIPAIQCLGHCSGLSKIPYYDDCIDTKDILLVGSEKANIMIENVFKTLRSCFSSKLAHIGFDEVNQLGNGGYFKLHGYEDKYSIYLKQLNFVNSVAVKYDFKVQIWSDMFFKFATGGEYYVKDFKISNDVVSEIPENASLGYWDYFSEDRDMLKSMIQSHLETGRETFFATSVYAHVGFVPNNAYANKLFEIQLPIMRESNIGKVLITLWPDNGNDCSYFACLPSLKRAADIFFEKDEEYTRRTFKEIVGADYDLLMSLDCVEATSINPDLSKITLTNKYFFYNDPFLGLRDSNIEKADKVSYLNAIKTLQKGLKASPKEFKMTFKKELLLAKFLEHKTYLGIKTRKAYRSGDKVALLKLMREYGLCISYLQGFKRAFYKEWESENKMHGWDVQQIRIQGLISRLVECRKRLLKRIFCKGYRIEELEETPLDFAPVTSCYNMYSGFTTNREI